MVTATDSILYIETDIPPRMTAADYRRQRCAPRRRSLRSRILRRGLRTR